MKLLYFIYALISLIYAVIAADINNDLGDEPLLLEYGESGLSAIIQTRSIGHSVSDATLNNLLHLVLGMKPSNGSDYEHTEISQFMDDLLMGAGRLVQGLLNGTVIPPAHMMAIDSIMKDVEMALEDFTSTVAETIQIETNGNLPDFLFRKQMILNDITKDDFNQNNVQSLSSFIASTISDIVKGNIGLMDGLEGLLEIALKALSQKDTLQNVISNIVYYVSSQGNMLDKAVKLNSILQIAKGVILDVSKYMGDFNVKEGNSVITQILSDFIHAVIANKEKQPQVYLPKQLSRLEQL
ncbi:hypothetical protein BDB01DRAFT_545028 [Pilobolus umbonatus]|nr:hypothetical protein BDB01DRAFT_545028 [Pilobolus umbonatus]